MRDSNGHSCFRSCLITEPLGPLVTLDLAKSCRVTRVGKLKRFGALAPNYPARGVTEAHSFEPSTLITRNIADEVDPIANSTLARPEGRQSREQIARVEYALESNERQ